MIRRTVSLVIATAVLTACGMTKGSPDASASEASGQDLTPEGPSVMSRLLGGGKPMPLDIQQAHPNRTVLQLTSLQVKPSETVLTAIITNGADRDIQLNRFGSDDTYLATGDGQKLYLSAPAANDNLTIPPGQRIEAELVFLGELRKGNNATLIINEGNQTGNKYTSTPGFRVAIPIEDAAFSDDGSKKN